jgi:large subunit ribosomal protein L10
MTRSEKSQAIETILETLDSNQVFYLADTSGMSAEKTTKLRRACFEKGIKLNVVKNTLLRQAMERSEKDFSPLFESLKGTTALMVAETGNVPGKLLKQFGKEMGKPTLKAAYIDAATFVGEEHLEALATLKSREELLGDVIGLLQSPAKNVIGALQGGGGQKIAGLVKALEERAA